MEVMAFPEDRESERRKQVGRRIRYYREARGIQQKDLAERLGVAGGTLSGIESGKNYPGLGLLLDIAKHLGVDAGWLCTEEHDAVDLWLLLNEPKIAVRFKETELSTADRRRVETMIEQLVSAKQEARMQLAAFAKGGVVDLTALRREIQSLLDATGATEQSQEGEA